MKYFLLLLFFIFSCTPPEPPIITGCTVPSACNYNPLANEDDASCVDEPDNCGTCDADPTNDCEKDCAGIWGGETADSVCEVCLSQSGTFDCSGNCCTSGFIYDLESLEQSDESCWLNVHCDVCDNNAANDCVQDCTGIWGGDHEADADGYTIIEAWTGQDPVYCKDLFALQMIIDENDFSVTASASNSEFHSWDLNENSLIEPQEFGNQQWGEDGRLIYLKVDIPFIITADIGELTELRELIFNGTALAEIPGTIGNLHKLESLNITSNPIISLPESISKLTNLEELLISNNNLSTLPDSIGNLANLTSLDAKNNALTSIPSTIRSLSNLQYLFLENNQINMLPDTFDSLLSLIELKLNDNQLQGLPDSFGEFGFGELRLLYLNNNQLQSLPQYFGNNMNSLEILLLDDNSLGSLPPSIGSMESLEELRLQDNNLSILPDEIGGLSTLIELWINNNSLESIPESMGNLGSLEILKLDHNDLQYIPDSFCNIYSTLTIFSITANQLCPFFYPDCIALEDVEAQYCETAGCPPAHFFIEGMCVYYPDYAILQQFLNANEYSQSLPAATGIPDLASECVNTDWWKQDETGFIRLVEIAFSHKELTSILPENIGDLDKLEILRLTDNHLIGDIPDNFTNLTNLKILKLNSNNLGCHEYDVGNEICLVQCDDTEECSGNLPEEIGALSSLDTLWLSYNNLTGDIPESITQLGQLTYLEFSSNNFTGSIPEDIGALSNLKYLYLNTNKLSGEIPQSIGSLTNMKRLYLHANDLSGEIPGSICNIYSANQYFALLVENNQFCLASTGYPECIPEYHLCQHLGQLGLNFPELSIDSLILIHQDCNDSDE